MLRGELRTLKNICYGYFCENDERLSTSSFLPYHSHNLWCTIFFIWKENNVSFSRYLDFWVFDESKFQNLWRHYINYCTLEVVPLESLVVSKWSGGETSPRPFSKKSKLSSSLDQQSEILYSLHLLYVQMENYQNMLKLRYWPLASISYKAFSKNKKRFETSLRASFCTWFFKKIISHVIFY